jgi:hypothetical protein
LSTRARKGQPEINARDHIGECLRFNKKGVPIAKELAQLYGDTIELVRLGNKIR